MGVHFALYIIDSIARTNKRFFYTRGPGAKLVGWAWLARRRSGAGDAAVHAWRADAA
jgi:hypothetical protein